MKTEDLYSIYLKHPQVSTDTRNIPDQSIFFCLKGERFDGNTFAKEALDKGAAYVVTDSRQPFADSRLIQVEDVLQTLQQLAAYHRSQLQIPVIGITGTNGKTTTKELVTAVLSRKYRVAATKGNLNNHIGVPLTLLSIRPEHEIAVVEMGANHPGEIAELCEMSAPDFGLITNIGKAHLEGFGSMDEIFRTKTALYRSVLSRNGTLFVCADDELLFRHATELATIPEVPSVTPWYLDHGFGPDWKASAERLTLFTYGSGQNAQCRAQLCGESLHLRFEWDCDGTVYPVRTQLVGRYNFPNAMAACAVGTFFAVPPDECVAALESYSPGNSRSQVIEKGAVRVIMDAYNANPTSMEAALRNVAAIPAERTFLALGDMCELGTESHKEHQRMVRLIQSLSFTDVFLFGPEFAETDAPQEWKFTDMEVLKKALAERLGNRPAQLMIKGSRAMRMERVMEIFS